MLSHCTRQHRIHAAVRRTQMEAVLQQPLALLSGCCALGTQRQGKHAVLGFALGSFPSGADLSGQAVTHGVGDRAGLLPPVVLCK